MSISDDILEIKRAIEHFDQRVDRMHLDFERYLHGELTKLPDLEGLEQELLSFSKRKIYDIELSHQLDRVLYKLQNRKKIWARWVEQAHHSS